MKSKSINKLTYYFSLLTWIANLCFIVFTLVFKLPAIWIVGIFVSVLIQGFLSGAFGDKNAIPDKTSPKTFLDYCLLISSISSAILAVFGVTVLLIAGGGPEIIDGSYYIVNHGDIVREISSAALFVFFCICDSLALNFAVLIFSSIMTLRIYRLYSNQKQCSESFEIEK